MQVDVKDDVLTIRIDLKQAEGQTRNGNILVASSHGWSPVAPKVSLSLNVVRKR